MIRKILIKRISPKRISPAQAQRAKAMTIIATDKEQRSTQHVNKNDWFLFPDL